MTWGDFMFEANLSVMNKTGLHARPAAELSQLCQKYNSDIRIIHNSNVINAKSIISILSSGINSGSNIVLQIDGKDEDEAGKAIAYLIKNMKE